MIKNKNIKIAYIVSTFPPYSGGMGNGAFNFAQKLSTSCEHQITIFTPYYSKKLKQKKLLTTEIINDNYKIVRLCPLLAIGNAAILPQLLWKLFSFDIIHLHYPFYGSDIFTCLIKLFRPKTKLILQYHMDTMSSGLKGFIFKFYNLLFLPLLIKSADKIVGNSLDYLKHSQLKKYYQKNPQKFKEILLGIDTKLFTPGDSKSNTEKTILFVGGLDKQHYFKGINNLLTAYAQIQKTIPQTKLIIVGHGDLEKEYQAKAKKLKIVNIEFANQVSNQELIKYYQQADALVLPSINKSEAFGLVLLEAMACGTPVIASNLPGVRSVFTNNQQGLLVEPNNVADLIEKLKIILSNSELANKLGQAGRQLILEKYTWKKIITNLNNIYLSL